MSAPESSSNERVIEMEAVSIGSLHASGVTVLEHVNWEVNRGQFWVLAGHHGTGKSDLLMTTAGLMGPLTGSYRFLGEPMPIFEDSRLKTRLKVGLMFNGGQLLNQLTLGQNITLPLRYHQDLDETSAWKRAGAVIEAMGLSTRLDQMPGTVGRHWQQRAGLARVLLTEPELVLLDDPLSGLDTRHTDWWVEFIANLSHGKLEFFPRPPTVVLTTDTLSPWRTVATHCAVLEERTLSSLGSMDHAETQEPGRIREYTSHSRWAFDPAH